MKKITKILIMALLSVMLITTGCSKKQDVSNNENKQAEENKEKNIEDKAIIDRFVNLEDYKEIDITKEETNKALEKSKKVIKDIYSEDVKDFKVFKAINLKNKFYVYVVSEKNNKYQVVLYEDYNTYRVASSEKYSKKKLLNDVEIEKFIKEVSAKLKLDKDKAYKHFIRVKAPKYTYKVVFGVDKDKNNEDVINDNKNIEILYAYNNQILSITKNDISYYNKVSQKEIEKEEK